MIDLLDDARAWANDHRADIVDAVAAAIAIPSVPGSVAQNDVHKLVAMAGHVGSTSVDRWVPDWDQVAEIRSPADGSRPWIDLQAISPIYARTLPELEVQVLSHRFGDGPSLVLNGHVDVVPALPDGWTTKPFVASLRDGWLYGRGSMDMKAGLMAAAFAFRYLVERELVRGALHLASVPEEETGGNGTIALLEHGYIGDAVVFTEPTDLRVVHRHLGIQRFLIELEGRSGGILRRSWGQSVTPALGRVLTRLDTLERERQASAVDTGGYDDDDLPGFVNVGTLTAGEWVATRAGSALIDGVMSILPGESQAEAAGALIGAVDSIDLGRIQARARVLPGGHRGAELAEDDPLVTAFTAPGAGRDQPGGPSRAGTMVCDAKIVSGGGWAPSIVLGPRGDGLHREDERVNVDSILTCLVQLVGGAARWFGTARSLDAAATKP